MPRHHAHQARVQLPLLAPVGVRSSKTSPCLSRNFSSRCLARCRSSRASSSARDRSRPCLALLVGHVHLHHVPGGEQPRQELRVAPVGLAPAVGAGPLHPGDRADDAVEAERAQRPAQVEARHPGLVDRLRGLEGERPPRDRRGVVGERRVRHLPGHRVEGAGGYRSGVDVETYGCGILVHREPLSSHCGARPRLVVRPLSPDPRSCDR